MMMKKASTTYNVLKKHYLVFVLLLLALLFFNQILAPGKILNNIHYINDLSFENYNVKEALGNNQLHLWTPYFYSGSPFIAIPEYYIFDLNFLFILLVKNIYLAMNLAVIGYLFIAGLGMYSLLYTIKKDRKIAFLAGIIYMFSAFFHSFMLHGHLTILAGYSLIPFVFLFAYKALIRKEWVLNSIIAGIFLALQILAGSIIFFLYASLLIGLFFLFHIIRKDFKKAIIKTILVAIIIFTVCVSLSAIKLLPSLGFSEMSNRGAGISKEEFLGEPVSLSDTFSLLVTNIGFKGISAAVGLVGFILLLFSFKSFRKRTVLFCILLAIFTILAASGTFVADLLYKFAPGFGKLRHIERVLTLFVFSASILIAFGYSNLSAKLAKYNLFKKYEKIFFALIIILILTELTLLQGIPEAAQIHKPSDIPILDHISKDKNEFRTVNFALQNFIGASGYNYNAQLGISSVKGGGGIWINDYIQYMALANQYNPSRMFGILNAKYIISNNELDILNFELIGNFTECRECAVWVAWGPYLYENKEVLPRAYMAQNSILVAGGDKNMIYSLLFHPDFNPNTVIIGGKSLEGYKQDDLKKYSSIILTEQPAQNDMLKLKNYYETGGKILPDIFNDKTGITNEDLGNLLTGFKGEIMPVEITEYSNNKITIQADKGFLVLSERYAYFPGWETNNKLELLKAQNSITAIYSESTEEVTFTYKPKRFIYGAGISIIALLAIIVFFSLRAIKK